MSIREFDSNQKKGAALLAALLLGWLVGGIVIIFSARTVDSFLQETAVFTLAVLAISIPVGRKALRLLKYGFTEEYFRKRERLFAIFMLVASILTTIAFIGIAIQDATAISGSIAASFVFMGVAVFYTLWSNSRTPPDEL